nr:hypothetical protein [Alteromonas australica]
MVGQPVETKAGALHRLTPLEKREAKQAVQADSLPVPAIDNLDAIDLVFVDGVLVTQVNTLRCASGHEHHVA